MNITRAACVPEIKDIDEGKRRVTHLISTATMDRAGDVVDAQGWDLRSYRKNPVVLVDHDYRVEKIIGRGKVSADGEGLWAVTEFADTELAQTAFDLHASGFARAWSVGFRGTKAHPIRDGREHECDMCSRVKNPGYGVHFVRQELLEYSMVSVPMNPEAVTNAVQRGICSAELAPLFFRAQPEDTASQPPKGAPAEANAATPGLTDEQEELLRRLTRRSEQGARELQTLHYLLRSQ